MRGTLGRVRSMRSVPRNLLAVLVAGSLALAGCSGGDDEPDAAPSSSEAPTQSAAPGGPDLVVPDGVEVTEEGSELEVGETATVAYLVRQGVVGALEITVTRLEKTSFKESFAGWNLSASDKEAKPYFVRAKVKNVGDTDLGGVPVPLYLVDGNNALVEATSFASKFEPCAPGVLPKKFPEGKSAKFCLVYLAPNNGDLTAVSFRPTQEVNPITWTGEIKKIAKPKKPKKNKGKSGDADGE